MRPFKLFVPALVSWSFLLSLGCSHHHGSTPLPSNEQNATDAQETPTVPLIAVSSADSAQCPAGGFIYSVYTDVNRNSVQDASDLVLSEQVLCNGVAGANGVDGSDGSNGANGANGADGSNGTDGANGVNGADGVNGHDGLSMVFETAVATPPTCPAGGSTVVMALDSDLSGGVSPADENFRSLTVCNGVDGASAPVSPLQSVDTIVACGNTVAFKEVLLLLQSGQVLGSVSNNTAGDMTRLAFLSDGTYLNTDGSNCTFTLATSSDGHTRSVSWDNQAQKSWSLP